MYLLDYKLRGQGPYLTSFFSVHLMLSIINVEQIKFLSVRLHFYFKMTVLIFLNEWLQSRDRNVFHKISYKFWRIKKNVISLLNYRLNDSILIKVRWTQKTYDHKYYNFFILSEDCQLHMTKSLHKHLEIST